MLDKNKRVYVIADLYECYRTGLISMIFLFLWAFNFTESFNARKNTEDVKILFLYISLFRPLWELDL
jgi:hypothetical protein